jgi:hypothetical protein
MLEAPPHAITQHHGCSNPVGTKTDHYTRRKLNMNIDRLEGAEAISAKARDIGKESGLVISECIWDIGQDFNLQHAHRLDLQTATSTVRIYFPDLELSTTGNEARRKRTEHRLLSAIAQLVPRTPTPVYATSA